MVFVAEVRRGHDVRYSIRNRHLRHGQRFLDGFRSVVHAAQNMTMHINHRLFSRTRHPRSALTICDIPRKNSSAAKIRLIFAEGIFFAMLPPAIPPRKTPGINSNPVFQETYPAWL